VSAQKILLTGATGFLGRHVLRAIRAAGHEAVVLVRQRSAWLAQAWKEEAGDVLIIEGNPLAPEQCLPDVALASVTAIIHAAAIVKHSRVNTADMTDFNVRGTVQMVQAAKRLGARMIFVSTSGTVGCYRYADIAADEDAPYAERVVGRWPYYAAKISAERESRRLADKLGVELVIVRPPVLLGPDDHRFRSTGYVQKVLAQTVPAIPSGGMHFTDVRDVAAALVSIAQVEQPRPIYHLPGSNTSLAEFFAMIGEVSGVRNTTRRLPPSVAHALAKVGAYLPWRPSWFPDPVVLEMSTRHWGLASLFASEIGYAPRAPRQTLADTVAWLRSVSSHSYSHKSESDKGR